MGTEYTQTTFRGLLVPETQVNKTNLDATSSYSQASPMVGVPEPQANTDLNLQATGDQTAGGELRVTTQRGGFGSNGQATFRWQNNGDTNWRGWNTPSTMAGWFAVEWTDGTGLGITSTATPHTITLANETVLVAYQANSAVAKVVKVASITVAGVQTASTGYSASTSITMGLHPCLLQLPSGRVLLFHYIENTTTSTVQVGVKYSDDNGSTWTLGTQTALDVAIDISAASTAYHLNTAPARGLRVAYSNGQLLMLIGVRANSGAGFKDYLLQYASADLGQLFEQVEAWSTLQAIRPNILPLENGFEVFYIKDAATVAKRSFGSAYDKGSTAPLVNITIPQAIATIGATTFSDGDLAAGQMDNNEAWLAFRFNLTGTFDRVGLWYDKYGFAGLNEGVGVSQTFGLSDMGQVYHGEGGGDYPTELTMTAQAGRLMLFHNWVATTGNEDNSVGCLVLGGYSEVTMPNYDDAGTDVNAMGFEVTWIPIERPSDMPNWTWANAGTFAADLTAGGLALSTTAGNNSYHRVPAGTIAEGIVGYFGVEYISAAAFSTKIRARYQLEDGSNSYGAKIAIKSTGVEVFDTVASASLGSAVIQTTSPGVEVLTFMTNGKLTVFCRVRDYSSSREWTTVVSNATLADGGAGTASEVRWGHEAGSTAQSKWYWHCYSSDEWACQTPYSTGFTNPSDLRGRAYGAPTYVADGVSVEALDGPTIAGDAWNIDSRYEYPIENMLPLFNPSPTRQWRSTDETAQTLIWNLTGPIVTNVLGLHLEGINWRTATLSGFNVNTGLWVSLASIDAATGQTGHTFDFLGDIFTEATGGAVVNDRYIDRNELTGGTVFWAPNNSREILSNTQGVLSNATVNVQRPSMQVAVKGGEPASTAADIWSPRITVLIHDIDLVYTKLKLVIDANQNTAQGYYKIGQMVLGAVHTFTTDYSWGRIQTSAPNTEMVTYRDGSRSSFRRGESRRSVTIGWLDGIDTSSIQGTSPSPDYVKTTSTVGNNSVGYRGDLPTVLQSLSEELGGPDTPLVYLPSFNAGTPNTIHLQGKTKALYGRMMGDITQDTLVGEEFGVADGEVVKVSNITIEGEL